MIKIVTDCSDKHGKTLKSIKNCNDSAQLNLKTWFLPKGIFHEREGEKKRKERERDSKV